MIEQHARMSVLNATGQARSPGTCGELVQGQFQTGVDFLVTLPIDWYSDVQVSITDTVPTVHVTPAHKFKTRNAVQKTLEWFGLGEMGANVRVISQLPEGKGMASSTADVVAACRATAQALGRKLSSQEISQIACAIEPTDGVMYAGVVCYDHRRCRLIEKLGALPPLQILVIDPGGEVDTLAFNRQPKQYTAAELDDIAQAYNILTAGIREHNPHLVGKAATLSARINQRLLPKPQLEDVVAIAQEYGAYGVNVAHSGTVIGMLFSRSAHQELMQAEQAIRARLGPMLHCFVVNVLYESEVEQ